MPSKKKSTKSTRPTPGQPAPDGLTVSNAIEFGQLWVVLVPDVATLWDVEDEIRLVSPKFIEQNKAAYDKALESVIIIQPNPGIDPDKFLRHLSRDGYLGLKRRTLVHNGAVQTRSWVSPEILDAQ